MASTRNSLGGRARGVQGFTLVELLVVIGIIALLISILLPSLSKAREASNRTVCLANLKQMATAFMLYANDNHQWFPYNTSFSRDAAHSGSAAGYASTYGSTPRDWATYGPQPEDWLFWQQTFPPAYRDLAGGGIGVYLGTGETTKKLLRCPSDDSWVNRAPPGAPNEGAYTFSYTFNGNFSFAKQGQVTRSTEKIIATEELTPNDGRWSCSGTAGNAQDLLSLRHGRHQADSTSLYTGIVGDRVNAVFADGHAAPIRQEDVIELNVLVGNPAGY